MGAALGTLIGLLIGFLVGFLVGLNDGSQVGEQAAPSAPRSVTVEKTVEKTIPAATPEPKHPDTTTVRPLDTARFSVIDPHRMMQTCALTDGFVRTGIIASTYAQVSVKATRCKSKWAIKVGC